MNVFYSKIVYAGKNKKMIHVSDLIIDGCQFDNVILDIETNLFAKFILNNISEEEKKNIEIESGYDVFRIANQPDMLRKLLETAANQVISSRALSLGYDNPATLVTYMFSSNEKWKEEASAFVKWRDAVWEGVHNAINENIEHPENALTDINDILTKIEGQ